MENEPPYRSLFPAQDWANPNELLVDYDYPTGKSQPEYGLTMSKKSLSLLAEYSFDRMIGRLT